MASITKNNENRPSASRSVNIMRYRTLRVRVRHALDRFLSKRLKVKSFNKHQLRLVELRVRIQKCNKR